MGTTRMLEGAFARDVDEHELQPNISGLRSLFSKILEETFWARLNGSRTPSPEEVLAYCEKKMPQLFSEDAATRGAALAAIEFVLEDMYHNTHLDEISWPLDPAWLLERTEDVLELLVEAFELTDISLPGAAELLTRRKESKILQSLLTGKDKYGEQHARTQFFADLDGDGNVQVGIHRRAGKVFLARRRQGEPKFDIIGAIKTSEAPFFTAMLRWLTEAMRAS